MTMSSPTVLITILNWNDTRKTITCLDSVLRSDYPAFQVLVIDNGSKEDPKIFFRSENPKVIYIHNKRNLGFTGGSNQGIMYAEENGFDYVWLVNNDVTVEFSCLTLLINTVSQDASIGLASPVLYNNPNERNPIYYGGWFNQYDLKRKRAKDIADIQSWMTNEPESICIDGTALLINLALVKKIGYFDNAYFAYDEDIDYSIRSARAGFRNIIVPDAAAYHELRSVKCPKIPPHYYFYIARNEFQLRRKNSIKSSGLLKDYLSWGIRLVIKYINENNQEAATATMDGIWNALFGKKSSFDHRIRLPGFLKRQLTKHPFILLRIYSSLQD